MTFVLPNIVQVADAETYDHLVGLGLGDRRIEWREQAGCKYLISMDGNGATCSRVAAALKSNSVLLKYDSPYQLFYFKGLRSWDNFIPVQEDQDVLDIMALGARRPRKMASVAKRGRRFYARFLNRPFCELYVAELLKAYSDALKV